MNVLAIGAHPDDIEAGCFGTLLKHKRKGDKVHICITTTGGYGDRDWWTILEELNESMSFLNPDSVTVLDNQIGSLSCNYKTVGQLDAIIDKFDIDTAYTHWYGDSHQDHRATYDMTLGSTRMARINNVYLYEMGLYNSHSHFVFRPQLYVNITDFWDKKINAIEEYSSYFTLRYKGMIEQLNLYRGSWCNCMYAEAFEVIREVR